MRPARFVGRDDQASALVAGVTYGRAMNGLVLGGPGIGKTTLVRQVATAALVVRRFGWRRWFVELDGVLDAEGLSRAVVRAVGLRTEATYDEAVAFLQSADGLLLLDNLETPWENDTLAVERLLSRIAESPRLSILGSLRGDQAPNGVRWSEVMSLKPLKYAQSRKLFLDISTGVSSRDPFLRRLLGALGGVPLAIELVALQATGGAEELWREWQRDGAKVARRLGVEESRLTSLERSIELSITSRRMNEDAHRLLRIVGRLPAGLAAIDCQILVGKTSDQSARRLRGVGLAYRRESRLDLLPPIREHVKRHHPPSQEDEVAWREHYLGLVADTGQYIDSKGGSASLARLGPELPNVDAAMRAALKAGLLDRATTALTGFEKVMESCGTGSAETIVQLAAAARRVNDLGGEAVYQMAFGRIALVRSDKNAAQDAFVRALSLFGDLDDALGVAEATQCIGDVAFRYSLYETARECYAAALVSYRELNGQRGIAACLTRLGEIAFRHSNLAQAAALFEEANQFYKKIGRLSGEAGGIMYLGQIAEVQGDKVTAEARYGEAQALFEESGDVQGQANCIRLSGQLAREWDGFDTASRHYMRALTLYRQIGDVLGEADCVLSMGEIASNNGDYDAALERYDEAIPLFGQIKDKQGIGNCNLRIGEVAHARGDLSAAKAYYDFSLPIFREIGDVLGQILCSSLLGDIARTEGRANDARPLYESALNLAEGIPRLSSVATMHAKLASVTEGNERAGHTASAKRIWSELGRMDLAAELEESDS